MFTGLVEVVGVVSILSTLASGANGGGTSLTISECDDILSDASLGDSISVNGVCLTIIEFEKPSTTSSTSTTTPFFKVGVAPETLRRSNLGSLRQGDRVNLERSVSASTRMGGHFVQGHVDTIATVLGVTPDGESLVFRLQPRERRVLRYIVEKGYVALDGASLTVTKVKDDNGEEDGWFELMLIAYTQEKVVTAAKKAGDDVNLEVDMLGKYVEKSVQHYFQDSVHSGSGEGDSPAILEKMVERILRQKLETR